MTTTPEQSFDICVYGGTASGLLAAIAAARRQKSVVVVEPSRWLGGMIGGGIRITTDCEYPLHTGGLTREMLLRERMFDVWNQDAGQLEQRQLWQNLVERHGVTVIFEHRVARVVMAGQRIDHLILDYAPPESDGVPAATPARKEALKITAQVFIDAGYEGDVMAKAGVEYTTGRESRDHYGESLAGVRHVQRFPGVDPFLEAGNPATGLLPLIPADQLGTEGESSRFMIPFNFRYVRVRQRTGDGMPAPAPTDVSPSHEELVRRVKEAGYLGSVRGNFNRRSLLDGSIPGLQADYPDGDWARRAEIWRTFIQHDRLVAEASGVKIRLIQEMYPDTGGWPHQLYIRMARRMKGEYVMTQADLSLQTEIPDSIGLGYYNVDIYPCRMVVLDDGTLATEGETWELLSPGPYQIPYRALTPKFDECTNLLVSVCISASHVACASIRMEPTFMIMGESAGVAAAQAVEQGSSVQQIDRAKLREDLAAVQQILEWDGEGYGPYWFNKRFNAWWEKHPEEYGRRPVRYSVK